MTTSGDTQRDELAEIKARAEVNKFIGQTASQDEAKATLKVIAALEAVLVLAEEWRYKGEFGWGAWQEGHGPDPEGLVLDGASGDIRKAIAEALR